jgi:hypothetical protein
MKDTKNKYSFKNDLACNITLIAFLVFSITHLVIVTLGFFCKINLDIYEDFNHIVAFVMIGVSLALYTFGFFIHKFSNVYIPAWFRIMFYIAFFLFTNVYYLLGWYLHIIGLIFFFAYISFLICIICLSVYFNTQKDNKNKLKTVPKHLIVNVMFYSIAIEAIFQFIVNFVKTFAFKKYYYSNLKAYVIEFGVMLGVTIIMNLLFALSLYSSKKFINGCLIKVNKQPKD